MQGVRAVPQGRSPEDKERAGALAPLPLAPSLPPMLSRGGQACPDPLPCGEQRGEKGMPPSRGGRGGRKSSLGGLSSPHSHLLLKRLLTTTTKAAIGSCVAACLLPPYVVVYM